MADDKEKDTKEATAIAITEATATAEYAERKTLSPKEEKKGEKAKEHTAQVSTSLASIVTAQNFEEKNYKEGEDNKDLCNLLKQRETLGIDRIGKPVDLSPQENLLLIFLASFVEKEERDTGESVTIKLHLNDLCKAIYDKISERGRKAIFENVSLVSRKYQVIEYTEGSRFHHYIKPLIELDDISYPKYTEEEKKKINKLYDRKKELEEMPNLSKKQQAELKKLKIDVQKFKRLKVDEFMERAILKNIIKKLYRRKKELETILNRNKEEEAELITVNKKLKEAKERETELTQIIGVKKTDGIELLIKFDKIFFGNAKHYVSFTNQLKNVLKSNKGYTSDLLLGLTWELLKIHWQYYSAAKVAEENTRKKSKDLSPEALQKEIDEAKKKALTKELTFATIKNLTKSDYETTRQYRSKFRKDLEKAIKVLIRGGLITADTTIGKDRVIFYFNEFYTSPKGEKELPPSPPTNLLQQ